MGILHHFIDEPIVQIVLQVLRASFVLCQSVRFCLRSTYPWINHAVAGSLTPSDCAHIILFQKKIIVRSLLIHYI